MQIPKAKFEFSLLPKILPAEHYKCASWREFIDRTRVNLYLHLPGVGTEILKQNAMIPRRRFKLAQCPFDINSLDPHNNIAHLWMVFAYLMHTDDFNFRNRQFKKQLSYGELNICEILYNEYLSGPCRNELMPIVNKFIIPCVGDLIIDYVDQTTYHTLLVNALFQLELYLRSLTTPGPGKYDRTPRYTYDTGIGLFGPFDFGFQSSTMLFYLTQVSGFQRRGSHCAREMEKYLDQLIKDYFEDKLPPRATNYISWDINPPNYVAATGNEEDEILECNKKKIKLQERDEIN